MPIIVRLQGGTGNQLFQYAFGRGISKFYNEELLIDRTTYDNHAFNPHKIDRPYSLGFFNTKVSFARDYDLFGFVWLRKHYKIFDALYRVLRLKSFFLPFYYPEQTFAFDSRIFKKKYSYYDGDWTTEKYFADIQDEIRKEISNREPLSEYSQGIERRISAVNAVSLHVRRGDYITDPVAAKYHGVCSMDYYIRAIEHIEKNVSNPHYFIFSDDQKWASENFTFLKHPFTCIRDGNKDYEDLMLISKCRHHIIANSTFGWWGAWLDARKDKIVICPQKWFSHAPKADLKNLFPENWVKL